jgi:uncharacterized membrane protein
MDLGILLVVVVAAAILGLPIAALVVANSTARGLRNEMASLKDKLRDLEAELARLKHQPNPAAPQDFSRAEITVLTDRIRDLESHLARFAGQVASPAPHASPQAPPTVPAPPRPTPLQTPPQNTPGSATSISDAGKTPAHLEPRLIPEPDPNAESRPIPEPVPLRFTLVESAHRPAHAAAHSGDNRSLESRIGSQWFNRVGILAVLIAVAWFLKLAFDNHWIGPLGRVLIGLLAGAGLIAWSERFEKRGFSAFAYSLKAVGSGTLYLSLWAAFSLYALMPSWAAFGAMIAVTAFNGIVSWARNAELLALYAIAGALSTPLLVSTGQNHQVALFTYLLILNVAVLVLVALRPWSRLLFATFGGTVFFFFGWWTEFYSLDQQASTAFFVTCFFLLYAIAPRLVRAHLDQIGETSPWDFLALIVLPIATAAFGFWAYCALLSPTTANWADPWIAVAFAAFYLLLLRMPAGGALHRCPPLLASLQLGMAVVFLTLAIPLKTHGRWLTAGWLTEGAALLWVSSRERQPLIRAFALICLLLGLFALLAVNPTASTTPIFNHRFAAYVFAIAVFAFVAWLGRNTPDDPQTNPIIYWQFLAGAAVLIINALILVAGSLEIHSYWWMRSWRGNYDEWNLSYSAFFMIFGAVLLGVGFWRRSAFLRWQALVLLAVTIAKVFLVDTDELSQGFRILSFLGLGVLLLAVSFVYQKDWLNLRGQGDRPS